MTGVWQVRQDASEAPISLPQRGSMFVGGRGPIPRRSMFVEARGPIPCPSGAVCL
jgi:hypothetical protein